jgi:hypothetical protein
MKANKVFLREAVVWLAVVVGLLWFGCLPGDLEDDLFGGALCGPWG